MQPTLEGYQLKILTEGIIHAYSQEDDLKFLLRCEMDVQVGAIARGNHYKNWVFYLIQDFEVDGLLKKFIQVILEDKPHSHYIDGLRAILAQIISKENLRAKLGDRMNAYADLPSNQSSAFLGKEEVVIPKTEDLFLSEIYFIDLEKALPGGCEINGVSITAYGRLDLSQFEDTTVPYKNLELTNLKAFLDDFQQALIELHIDGIKPLAEYDYEQWQTKLWRNVQRRTEADLIQFSNGQTEPPFIIGLKALLQELMRL